MFQSCMIHIRQKGQNGSANQEKWVQVKLMKARVGAPPFMDMVFPTSTPRGDDEPYNGIRQMSMMADGYGWWGRWTPGPNSVNQSVDNDYTIGTAHKDARYWIYNQKTMELHFVQRSMESGWAENPGGPPTGYKVVYTPALELYNAALTGRGVVPFRADESSGWVRIANRALRAERIFWEKTFAA